ncbi:MAG: protein kinase [Planctomycetes bacterium]|nr:protein kinase [Planctomycetota bacterium]
MIPLPVQPEAVSVIDPIRPSDMDSPDDTLAAGLRAAFGGSSHVSDALGASDASPSVLLRDDVGDSDLIIKPSTEARDVRPVSHGRYQVLGEIARGGVGIVLKGRDLDLGRDVAMKVLKPDHAGRSHMVQRFIEEAQITGQLQHPGVLPIYELGRQDNGRPYFAMKLVRGQTLAALLSHRSDPVYERQKYLRIFAQVCETIAYAHAKGVIHRDLKPSNVMVGAFGELHVVDWGLAKVLLRGGAADESPTARAVEQEIATIRTGSVAAESLVGTVMGTPAYMSPEQASGRVEELDERADVFSLGAMLCEILTGRPPYRGENALIDARAGRQEEARTALGSCGADAELVELASQCMSVSRDARPRDASAVSVRMSGYLESLETKARALEMAAAKAEGKAQQERRTRRVTLALAGAVLFGLFDAGAIYLWAQRRQATTRIATAQLANDAIERAAVALERARRSPIGEKAAWGEVQSAATAMHGAVSTPDMDGAIKAKAAAFDAEYDATLRERRFSELIEDALIQGATHEDKESWLWMEGAMRQAFREYGIDLDTMSHEQIVELASKSRIATDLADALELWIATHVQLGQFGEVSKPMEELLKWSALLYRIDTDPFRTELRKLLYSGKPDLAATRALEARADLAALRPRTISWLAMMYPMAGDTEAGCSLYARALLIHPSDFMFTFDYAYTLMSVQRHVEAIPILHRCIAIRPRVGGIWRKLGIALRETGDPSGAVTAFEQSILHQPNHASTYVDLSIAHFQNRKWGDAAAAGREAVRLKPELAEAHVCLGKALHAMQAEPEATEALTKALELARSLQSVSGKPPPAWVEECRQLIQDSAKAGAPDEAKDPK